MTKVTIYKNVKNECVGFKALGHAGYAEEGEDIVCAAISILTINTMNAIETFTDASFDGEMDESGSIHFRITSDLDDKSQLLLSTLALGLTDISNEYGEQYLKVHYKEV